MLAQVKPVAYTMVQHIDGTGAAFTVTVVRDRAVHIFQADPSTGTCTCGLSAGGWCAHLVDAEEFLVDHACPLCGVYSAFGVLCSPCVLALGQPAQLAVPA